MKLNVRYSSQECVITFFQIVYQFAQNQVKWTASRINKTIWTMTTFGIEIYWLFLVFFFFGYWLQIEFISTSVFKINFKLIMVDQNKKKSFRERVTTTTNWEMTETEKKASTITTTPIQKYSDEEKNDEIFINIWCDHWPSLNWTQLEIHPFSD